MAISVPWQNEPVPEKPSDSYLFPFLISIDCLEDISVGH